MRASEWIPLKGSVFPEEDGFYLFCNEADEEPAIWERRGTWRDWDGKDSHPSAFGYTDYIHIELPSRLSPAWREVLQVFDWFRVAMLESLAKMAPPDALAAWRGIPQEVLKDRIEDGVREVHNADWAGDSERVIRIAAHIAVAAMLLADHERELSGVDPIQLSANPGFTINLQACLEPPTRRAWIPELGLYIECDAAGTHVRFHDEFGQPAELPEAWQRRFGQLKKVFLEKRQEQCRQEVPR